MTDTALTARCPTCHAPPGEPCHRGIPTPHRARQDRARSIEIATTRKEYR
ncbi:zinc finger domain-containing protein [Mycolicibacter kumamotonensis]